MTYITVVNGPASGTQVALARGETCTIGSGADCTIRLELPGIAKVQAEIKALKQEGFGVKRAGGPVAVNGTSVDAVRLNPGDVIDVGSVQLLYGPARPRAEQGRMLGGFRLLEVLGKGGMGTVYRAEQVSLHRQVALKVLDQALTQDPVFVARFVAEARAAARLHHPNVVQVYDVGHEGTTYYYSMELMEGSVESKLKAQGKLDVADATKAVADAARGLAYAESLRIVHRDIKPDNLMLDHHGSVKLADLGLAMTDENEESKLIGTPHFMSPEQILRKPLDHRSDLYSLGCTFYRLLTGKNACAGSSVKDILRAQVKDDPEPAHKVDAGVPPEISAIVQRLMEKDPAKRVQSAAELVEALEQALKPPVRTGLLIGGVVLALAVAGGAIAYAMTREGKTTVIHTKASDPQAEANARALRETEAELAYVRATKSGLSGLALADALEAMAREHGQSDYAVKARAEATRVRAEVAAAQAATAQRAAEVERWRGVLSARVRAALAQSDYRAAAAGLALDDVPDALRADPALAEASRTLGDELQRHAGGRLDALLGAVTAAQAAGDADALERAAEQLAPAVEGDAAWPESALPAPERALTALADARAAVQRLREEQGSRRVEAGWNRMQTAFAGAGGVLAAVHALEWQAAAEAAGKVAAELAEQPAGTHASALAQSLARAIEHLGRVKEAARAGTLTLAVDGESEPCAVSSFAAEGDQAGFTVKVGPKHQPRALLIKLTSLDPEALERALALPDGDYGCDLACVLGWLELARALDAARAYLLALDPTSDASGTGAAAFPVGDQSAVRLAERLAGCSEPWTAALRGELEAAALLASGLQAFSGQRNLAAAEHIEQLLRTHPRRLLVAALR